MPRPRSVGLRAEDRAADYLQKLGFTLLTRRFKARAGEIDLVALDAEVLVFVEVKMRRSQGVKPEDALDSSKMSKIFEAAEEYLAKYEGPPREVRFDLVAIGPQGIRHTKAAFIP